MVEYDYGTDFDSTLSFENGDIKLIRYKDNIRQAIMNRLNTIHGTLDLFYDDYGSFTKSFLGWKRKEKTLKFLKIEVENTIADDPRINSFSTELSYADDGSVRINVHLYNIDEIIDLNFVLDNNGISEVE